MQPGIPNMAALMPHMPLSVQQLGNMTKPLTLGQRSSPASGTLQLAPMKDMPQVSVSASTQHAAAKPPVDVQVFDPQGKLLGIIEFPEQPANCTFAGPGNKTLYATARTSLYAVEMEATGHVFPAGKR